MANKINIDNYEAFLLDYMEGTISTEDLVSLQIFAAQHPHLQIDLNDVELVELNSDKVSFEGKNNLKKVSDEQFVAYIEDQLNSEEKQNVEALCDVNPALATELKLYKKTLVSADETIVFENKASLKREETKVLWLFSREVLAAAASLILIAGLWFIFKGSLGSANLSSEKIKGNSISKTFAVRNNSSASSFTVGKVIENTANNNHVAYSNSENKREFVKKENKSIKENNTLATNDLPKDSALIKGKEILPVKKTDYLADNSMKQNSNAVTKPATSYIITEKTYDEDEKTLAAATPKKGFWSKAMNALNNLNKLGVKKAKGTETIEQNNEQYVLTMGNLRVENNKYNAN